MVVPDVEVAFALFQRTNGVLPLVDVVDAIAVGEATTWETHELGFEVGDGLRQVGTQAVLPSSESFLGKQADEVDGYLALLFGSDDQTSFGRGARASHFHFLLLPFFGGVDGCTAHTLALFINDLDAQLLLAAFRKFGP